MKWSQLRKEAEKRGWCYDRPGKKHDIFRHPEKDFKIQLGRHSSEEVKTGLFNKLRKQIGF